MTEEPPAAGGSLAQILEDRRRKATLLNASGVRPWGVDFTPDHSCQDAADLAPSEVGVRGTEVAVAGRILRLRPSGGITFADIFDATGRLQLLASADGENPQLVEQLGEIACDMWRKTADAYGDRSRDVAEQVEQLDDELDELHVLLTAEIASGSMALPVAIEAALVARFYERFGDHAVNLSRRIRSLPLRPT